MGNVCHCAFLLVLCYLEGSMIVMYKLVSFLVFMWCSYCVLVSSEVLHGWDRVLEKSVILYC